MVAEITMVVILGFTTIIGTLFFNLRNIRKCRACGCSCEQEINQEQKQRDDPPISNPVEMVQHQNIQRHATPQPYWNNLPIPEEKFKRSSSNKSMPPVLHLEEKDL